MSDSPAYDDLDDVASYYNFLGSNWIYDLCVETLLPIDRSIRRNLLSQAEYPKDGRVLDAATGSGRNIPTLLELTDEKTTITGIDISEGMLEIARSRVSNNARVQLIHTAIEGIASVEGYDVVTASYLLSVAPDPERVVRQMLQLLKPDGELLILAVMFPEDMSWPLQKFLSFEEWIAKADLSRNPEQIIVEAGGEYEKVLTRLKYIRGYRVTHR